MIDFRYHVVSIVAVFIALAVGIVLGAGPLKEDIGSTLTAQVTQLRADKSALRDQLKESQDGVSSRDTYAGLVAPAVIAGQLPDREVALVVLPDADAGLVKRTTHSLSEAGAKVVGTISVSDKWTDPDEATARTQAVTPLAQLVGVEPSVTSAGELPSLVLSRAIFGAPEGAKGGSVGRDTSNGRSRVLQGLDKAGLISLQPGTGEAATSVVVVAGPLAEDETLRNTEAESYLKLLATFGGGDRPALLVSGHEPGQSVAVASPLVTTVRADPKLTSVVSTVDDGNLSMGQGTLVLALHGEYDDANGHYGLAGDASAVAPEIPANQ
ncbi:copper transporter [Segeticoccus rhizosphaerae]|uniref:copper transporter n=1 Tax=Segeticoccus rhizosphaerae TaxID=1104777 RepID=UPI0013900392|nr:MULTISPECIES: copper transporter [Intrasporangiaceae]